jgi:hypothetical protein
VVILEVVSLIVMLRGLVVLDMLSVRSVLRTGMTLLKMRRKLILMGHMYVGGGYHLSWRQVRLATLIKDGRVIRSVVWVRHWPGGSSTVRRRKASVRCD